MMLLQSGSLRSVDQGTAKAMLRGSLLGPVAFLAGAVGFGFVELHDHPERWSAWVVSNGANVFLLVGVLWGRARVRTLTEARALTVFLVLGLATVMTTYTVIEHASWRMLATGLIILLAGVSLLIPVGTVTQAIASAGGVAIYIAPLLAGLGPEPHIGLPLVALISAAGVSVLGAYLTERYRDEVAAAGAAARNAADVATTLIEIGRELNATLSLSEVLRRLADRATEVFGAPIGAINLIDEQQRLRIVAVCGLSDEEADAARDLYLDLNLIPGAWDMLAAPLLELPDVGAQDRLPPTLLQQFGYHGLLMAPMHRGAKVLGAVTFTYRAPRPPFTERERQLARGLAEQAALALENARLYEEQHEAAETAEALVRVAERLGSTLDPQQVAQDLVRLAAELLACDRAAVYRWHDGRWNLVANVSPHLPHGDVDELRAIEFGDGDFPFVRALRQNSLVEIADAASQNLIDVALLHRWGVRSSLAALLSRSADPLGFIIIAHGDRIGPFSPRERRVLSGLAQLGVVALTNAQLAEQLRGANRVKSEFVATMSHELRTPLNAILGYTDLLRDEVLGPLQPPQIEALDRMRERSLDLLQLIQATLDLNRLEAGVPTIECSTVSIGELVESVRAQIPARWLKPEVRLEFQAEAPEVQLWTDTGKLHAVARNLIHNALKFTSRGNVEMRAWPDAQRQALVIEVRDTGCGIPADKIGEIFDMFAQAGNTANHDGVGLGLHLSRRFVTLLGGSIDVESRLGEGTTFRVLLPLGRPPAATAAGSAA